MTRREFLTISACLLLFLGATGCIRQLRTPPDLTFDETPTQLYLSERAQDYFNNKEYMYAVAYYDAIINYIDKFEYDTSLSEEDVRAEKENTLAWANYEIGFCYYRVNNYEKANEYFDIVLSTYPVPAPRILAEKLKLKIAKETLAKTNGTAAITNTITPEREPLREKITGVQEGFIDDTTFQVLVNARLTDTGLPEDELTAMTEQEIKEVGKELLEQRPKKYAALVVKLTETYMELSGESDADPQPIANAIGNTFLEAHDAKYVQYAFDVPALTCQGLLQITGENLKKDFLETVTREITNASSTTEATNE